MDAGEVPLHTAVAMELERVCRNTRGISGICRHAQQQIEDYRNHLRPSVLGNTLVSTDRAQLSGGRRTGTNVQDRPQCRLKLLGFVRKDSQL